MSHPKNLMVLCSSRREYWKNGGGGFGSSSEIRLEGGITCKIEKVQKRMMKGFSFEDDCLTRGNWMSLNLILAQFFYSC